ncbi:MAG: hypothetical protein L0312_29075 [Acidobacteria bacterium]|nr:hypothetical protein [Acidobacteriota bacterium]
MTEAIEAKRLTCYLLGELSEAEEAQLEQQYLQDEALHQELLLAEDEVIESFLRNELPPGKRHRFESYFLASPARRERLETASAMLRAIETEPSLASGGRSVASPGLAGPISRLLAYRVPVTAVAAAVLLLGAGLALLALRVQTAKEQLRAERASWLQQQEALKLQLTEKRTIPSGEAEGRNADKPSPRQSASSINHLPSVVLMHGQARDAGELKRVVLSAESRLLLLYLVLPEAASVRTYRVAIKTDEGKVLSIQTNLPLSAIEGKQSAALLLESRQLKPGDYVVTLLGTNSAGQERELAEYVLRLVQKR